MTPILAKLILAGLFTCDMNVNIALGLRLVAQRRADSFPRLAPSLALALHTSLCMKRWRFKRECATKVFYFA